jgi:hypothetical protein
MRKMRRPAVITAPWGTPEETARTYGIPKRRANELRKMVEDSLAKKGYLFLKVSRKDSTSSKNGAGNRASRSHRLRAKVQASTRAKSKSGNASRRKTTRAKAKTSR